MTVEVLDQLNQNPTNNMVESGPEVSVNSVNGQEEKEPTISDKEKKVLEIQKAALRNPGRKMSQDMRVDKGSIDIWSTFGSTARAARKFRGFKKGSNDESAQCEKRDRSYSVQTTKTEKKNRKSSYHGPKLPALVQRERKRRSSTMGCVAELKSEARSVTELTPEEGETQGDQRLEKERENNMFEKKIQIVIDQEACNNLAVAEEGKNVEGSNLEQTEKSDGVYRLCGRRSCNRNSSSRVFNNTDGQGVTVSTRELDMLTITDQTSGDVNVPTLPQISDKVNDFMKKTQPCQAPQSLRISRQLFDAEISKRRTKTEHLPQIKVKDNQELLFTANFFMNPFTRKDGESWYYGTKEGRCRYLRVPPTPVLTVEEIFSKGGDEETGKDQERIG